MPGSELGNPSNESERLFEQYLTAQGYTDWTHERPIEGKATTPDYRLRFGGGELFFDVKEFDGPMPSPGFGTFDGYGPIRAKIERAKKQFKNYREHSCSLVLANPNGAFVMFTEPWAILGAMFGNLGVRFPVGPSVPAHVRQQQAFLGGGRMRNPKWPGPQNTTISAIVSLSFYGVHQQRLHIALHNRAAQLGRKLTGEELLDLVDSVPVSEPENALRVIAFDNPDARLPLNPGLFRGPFDERWGRVDNHMERIFMGAEVGKIDSELAGAREHSPL